MPSVYTEGIFKIGKIIFNYKDPIGLAVKFNSIRSVLLANYWECTVIGLKRIENLPEEEKERLWQKANGIGKGKNKTTLINLCRCIHWYEKMKE